MSTIAAGTTSGTALVSTGDTSGTLVLQTNGTTTALTIGTDQVVALAQPLPVTSGGTGSTTSTGSGAVVRATSPTIATPTISTPSISAPTFTGAIYANGAARGNVTAVAALDIDCSVGNYFTKTINGASAFTFSNPPASGSYAFTLELTVTSGSPSWPAAVKWPGDTAPTLSSGKTSLLIFVTDDAGTRWRGASLVDYTT